MKQTVSPINGPLYQWDIGRKVRINCPEAVEIHFANAGAANALVRDIYEESGERIADVPNELLQESGHLYVYLVKTSENEEQTKHANLLHVHKRPKPEDYACPPNVGSGGGAEVKTFDVAKITFANGCSQTYMHGTITDENGQVLNYVLEEIIEDGIVYVPVGSVIVFENWDEGNGNGVMFSATPDRNAGPMTETVFWVYGDTTFTFSVEPYW